MEHQVPAWEGQPPAGSKPSFFTKQSLFASSAPSKEIPAPVTTQSLRPTLRERFDRLVPPYRTYFGRSRRTFLLVILIILLCLLALILGLGIGLGKKKSSSAALPLPSNTATFTGDLTYYDTGLGACGITSSNSDPICAVSHIVFDAVSTGSDPNSNPLCGKKVRVVHFDQRVGANKSIDLTVVDRCVGCKAQDLDLSYSAFDYLADRDLGRVTGEWAWLQ